MRLRLADAARDWDFGVVLWGNAPNSKSCARLCSGVRDADVAKRAASSSNRRFVQKTCFSLLAAVQDNLASVRFQLVDPEAHRHPAEHRHGHVKVILRFVAAFCPLEPQA